MILQSAAGSLKRELFWGDVFLCVSSRASTQLMHVGITTKHIENIKKRIAS